MSSTLNRVAHEERGQVAMTVAFLFPFFIIFMALVLTAGDWWVHKRHLQTQADAAALASAQGFGFPCSNSQTRVETAVANWGGTQNPQVGGTQSNVHFVVNKPNYYNQAKSDDTPNADPCVSKMVDVKATETGLKGPIGVGLIPMINTHARVEFFQALSLAGNEPIAVPEPAPKRVHAMFVDESATPPTVIAERDLAKNGTDANGNAIWDNSTSPLDVNVGTKDRIGVRIALSGQTGSVTCGDTLVECYDGGSANGLVFVRGWTGNGSGAQTADQPKARSVTLTSTTCADAYFTVAACNVAVRADVDFGTGASDPTTNTSPGVGALLRAVVNGTTYNMSYSAGHWTSAESIPVAAAAGPIDISLQWAEQRGSITALGTCTNHGFQTNGNNANPCQGTISNVQRTFGGGDTRSGPIQVIQIQQGGIAGANSLRQCDSTNTSCTYPLVVRLSLQGTLANAQSANDPVVVLRDGTNNQPGTIDCDPAISTLKDEVARLVNGQVVRGCDPTYTPNNGTPCPKQSQLWASTQPWNCVAVQPGTSAGQVSDGFNLAILGDDKPSTCTHPNLYKTDFGNWDPSDPRIIQLLLTPFGAFSGTGNDSTVPVTGFATFYVTGWKGNADKNPCQNAGDDPAPKAGVVGHFIKYVQTAGTPSPSACDDAAISTCLAVLTR
jgi:Putative Flp pilus-assembly TadE/G-like